MNYLLTYTQIIESTPIPYFTQKLPSKKDLKPKNLDAY